MFKLMGNKRLFILLIGVILAIALMGLTLGNRESATLPEKMISDTVSFAQGLVYKPAGYIAGFFGDIGNLRKLYTENKIMKKRLMQYARDSARLNALETQNSELERALAFTERQKHENDYVWHAAQAVAISPDPVYNTTIKINLGTKDGIRENMAVATEDGLIGRIERVSPYYATVQLISDIIYKDVDFKLDTSKAIAATVKSKNDGSNPVFGMIESYNNELGYLVMNKIPDSDSNRIEKGDTVITSGLGGVFPEGIVVGTIVSKQEGDFGITYKAMIKPAAHFRPGQTLFVIEVPQP